MSRGLRNCNPGNIRRSGERWQGEVVPSQDAAFKQFESMAWGYRAMFKLLDNYRSRYGLKTLRQLIGRYAPPCENHTDNYVNAVSRRSGTAADAPVSTVDRGTMVPIVEAMSFVENGVGGAMKDIEEGWELFIKL